MPPRSRWAITEAIVCANPKDVVIVHKKHDDHETNFLSPAENRLAGRDIPVKPAFIQVGVRKHDVALAVGHVALPILQAHGAK